jgi:hypothetical protein
MISSETVGEEKDLQVYLRAARLAAGDMEVVDGLEGGSMSLARDRERDRSGDREKDRDRDRDRIGEKDRDREEGDGKEEGRINFYENWLKA